VVREVGVLPELRPGDGRRRGAEYRSRHDQQGDRSGASAAGRNASPDRAPGHVHDGQQPDCRERARRHEQVEVVVRTERRDEAVGRVAQRAEHVAVPQKRRFPRRR